MLIRPATSADIPRLLEIERSAVTASHWSADDYSRIFSASSSRMCLVAEEQGVALGFLIARAVDLEWELENIVIDNAARGRGLGSLLIEKMIAQARSAKAAWIHLEVRESNSAARRLYGKCGFIEAGRRKAYYSNPQEDAILYTLALR